MSATSLAVIANPAAGAGRGRALVRTLGPLIAAGASLRETRAPGDGVRLAREAVEGGARELISVGGDGTHSEVVEGILQAGLPAASVALRPLHAGTGGDFRRLLHPGHPAPERPDDWLADDAVAVDAGHLAFVDLNGAPAERHFLNLCTFGLGGLVDRYVNASSKRLGGRASFLLATLRAFLKWRPSPVHLHADGEDLGVHEITNVVVGNGRYCGGGMHLAPDALLDDGLLDLLVIPHASLPRALRALPHLYDGRVDRLPGALTRRARQIRATPLDPDRPAWLDVDGEDLGRLPATLSVVPGAIRLRQVRGDVLVDDATAGRAGQ